MVKVTVTSTGTKNATEPKMIARFAEFDPMTPPKNMACLPRLTAVMTAVKRGKHAMFLGGVIGSNSANLAIILGSVAFLVPVEVTVTFTMNQFPIMILFIFGLWISMLSGRIQRWQSGLLLLGYLSFTGLQFL